MKKVYLHYGGVYLHYGGGRIAGFMYHGKSLAVGVEGIYLGLLLLVSGFSNPWYFNKTVMGFEIGL